MTDHSRSPRIGPLDPSDRSAEADELLSSITVADGSVMNIFTTLVRHPGLFRLWLPFGGKLLAGKLPARDREFLILRTSWRVGAEYEWGHHVPPAKAAGVSDGEIARLCTDSAWEGFDATLVIAADELHDSGRLSDETWAALSERYDERQLIEVPMLVGHYHMVGYALNSLGVQLEDGVSGFPS